MTSTYDDMNKQYSYDEYDGNDVDDDSIWLLAEKLLSRRRYNLDDNE